MADDDFDFEIYGDETNPDYNQESTETANGAATETPDAGAVGGEESNYDESYNYGSEQNQQGNGAGERGEGDTTDANGQQYEQNDRALNADQAGTPQQGTKRKSPTDEEPLEPGAVQALIVGELDWWVTDDVLRGWAVACAIEPQLKDVTFSEHKVNGKSKGNVFLEFDTAAAAQAVKHHVESLLSSKDNPAGKKYTVYYQAPSVNPFKNPPKDHATREKGQQHSGGRGGMSSGQSFGGGRGGFQNRGGFNRGGAGGYNNSRGGYNNNNSGSTGGFNNSGGSHMGGAGAFNNSMGGFNNAMGGFNRRGGFGANAMGAGAGAMGRGGFNPMMSMMGNMMGGMGGMGAMGGMGGMPNMANMGMMGGFGGQQQQQQQPRRRRLGRQPPRPEAPAAERVEQVRQRREIALALRIVCSVRCGRVFVEGRIGVTGAFTVSWDRQCSGTLSARLESVWGIRRLLFRRLVSVDPTDCLPSLFILRRLIFSGPGGRYM